MDAPAAHSLACLPARSLEVELNPGSRNHLLSLRVLAPSPRIAQAIFRRDCAMARFNWKDQQARFDPTIMLTVLIGLIAAAFLATAM